MFHVYHTFCVTFHLFSQTIGKHNDPESVRLHNKLRVEVQLQGIFCRVQFCCKYYVLGKPVSTAYSN